MTIAATLGAEQCRDPAADDFPDFSRASGGALGQRALIYYYIRTAFTYTYYNIMPIIIIVSIYALV
jgi:hypothetical protein